MTWQNRIVGYRVVKASELTPNDNNWRKHQKRQKDALTDVLDKVGWVDTVLYNVRTGRLIDGHLRQSLAPDADVPVLDVDLSEEEERLVLATFDPIGAMAEAEKSALEGLMAGLLNEDESLAKLLEAVAIQEKIEAPKTTPLDDFPSFDEGIDYEYCCPKCNHKWSGRPK